MPSKHSEIMTKKCVECHYWSSESSTKSKENKKDDDKQIKGGHTFQVDEKYCLKCHENIQEKLLEWNAKIIPLANELKELLDKYPNKNSRVYLSARKNYALAMSDPGMNVQAIHNPAYAVALLKAGISALRADSTWK
ncbi:MAG: hypothetical protein ACPL7B_06315 [Candidatus Poribacteria bacterium]